MLRTLSFFAILILAVAPLVDAQGEDNTESDLDQLPHHYRHHRRRPQHQLLPHQLLNERNSDHSSYNQLTDQPEDEALIARRSFPNGNSNGCTACAGRDLFLNFTKEELRVEILRKLGMRAPPDVAAKKLIPKNVVRHLMHKHSQELTSSNEAMNDEPLSGDADVTSGFEMDEAVDEDDYHFQTKQINILAQSRE